MTTKQRLEIVSADEYEIEQEVLSWAELDEVWEASHLADHIDFMRDIVGQAKRAEVEERDLDADGPGGAGSWYVVTTDDEEALRKELRRLVNVAKREHKPQTDKAKAAQKASKLLTSRGPQNGCHLCTIQAWDGLSGGDEYRYELAGDGMLWLRFNGTWKATERRADSGASAIEGLRLARDAWGGGGRLGPGDSIVRGEGVTSQELEAVWGKQV